MNNSLPTDIVVTTTPDGVRYRLPVHRQGKLLIAGVVCVFFAVGLPVIVANGTIEAPVPVVLFIWSLVLVLAAGILSWGVWLLAGHNEITVTAGELHSIVAVGRCRWTRRRSLDRLLHFTVLNINQSDRYDLRVEFRDAAPLMLACGYPHEWLHTLADDLSRRIQVTASVQTHAPEIPRVRIHVTEQLVGRRRSWRERLIYRVLVDLGIATVPFIFFAAAIVFFLVVAVIVFLLFLGANQIH